jgi:hypothetical protein
MICFVDLIDLINSIEIHASRKYENWISMLYIISCGKMMISVTIVSYPLKYTEHRTSLMTMISSFLFP